jgi:hypothetical protein
MVFTSRGESHHHHRNGRAPAKPSPAKPSPATVDGLKPGDPVEVDADGDGECWLDGDVFVRSWREVGGVLVTVRTEWGREDTYPADQVRRDVRAKAKARAKAAKAHAKAKPAKAQPAPAENDLRETGGLRPGDRVHCRLTEGGPWQPATVRAAESCRTHPRPLVTVVDRGGAEHWIGYGDVREVVERWAADERTAAPEPEPEGTGRSARRLRLGGRRSPVALETAAEVSWQKVREQVVYAGGTWRRASRFLPLVLRAGPARLLDFLANWQKTHGQREDPYAGFEWFACPRADIAREGFIEPRAQEGVLRRLREKGYLEVRVKHLRRGTRRQFRIDYRKLYEDIAAKYAVWTRKYGDPAAEDGTLDGLLAVYRAKAAAARERRKGGGG